MSLQPITYAALEWQPNGEPYAAHFKDVYFRSGEGLAETQYIFLQGNGLPERWQHQEVFTIIETGFGTGLNFLATCKAWQESGNAEGILHYISFEKFPVRPSDIKKIHQLWPEFKPYSNALLAHYPAAISGFHRIHLPEWNIVLTLVWGDVNIMLPELQAKADAWFLDGFAPRQNPEMWNHPLFELIAEKTAEGGSFATFTATGYVRRGLQAAGFLVEKQPGFLGKREMLTGIRGKEDVATDKRAPLAEPWFITPSLPKQTPKHAIIIGGGLAGTATAYSLAKRGWKITLIERHGDVAQEASGNPAGIVMPLIAAPEDVVGQFYLEAYNYAVRHFSVLASQYADFHWQQCGVLQLMTQDEKRLRYRNAASHPALMAGIMQKLSPQEASMIAGISINREGWFFPKGGYVSPAMICKAHLEAYPDNINKLYHKEAITLEHDKEWHVADREGGILASAPVVIIANAFDASYFRQCRSLPFRHVRGQVSFLPATPASRKLQAVLCYEGYMIPQIEGVHCVGATFYPDVANREVTPDDHVENIAMLQPYIAKEVIGNTDVTALKGRVAFRAVSPDRRPFIGHVPDVEQFQADYHDLAHGKQHKSYPVGSYHPGLYITSGHGSRGLVSTPLAAELLACQITNEPLPLPQDLVKAVNPARFLIRNLKKTKT